MTTKKSLNIKIQNAEEILVVLTDLVYNRLMVLYLVIEHIVKAYNIGMTLAGTQ